MKFPTNIKKLSIVVSCLSGAYIFVLANSGIPATYASSTTKTTPVPIAPTGGNLAKCLLFSKPIKFKVEKRQKSLLFEDTKPIWSYLYSAEKQTVYAYVVELFPARTLFGKGRDKYEKMLEKRAAERKRDHGKYPRAGDDISGVDTRPDGRKVYFATVGFGPGGAFQLVFTTIGRYDLAFIQVVDFEDDMPQEKRVKDSAVPRRKPLETFKQLENCIPNLPIRPTNTPQKSTTAG